MLPFIMVEIVPSKDRPRKSSGLMKWDPYTLLIILGKDGKAEGSLYVDDGETFDFQQGAFIHRRFVFEPKEGLRSVDLATKKGPKTAEYLKTMQDVRVERIVVVNAPRSWEGKESVRVVEEGAKSGFANVPVSWHAGGGGKAAWAVVRDPGVGIARDWRIDFS